MSTAADKSSAPEERLNMSLGIVLLFASEKIALFQYFTWLTDDSIKMHRQMAKTNKKGGANGSEGGKKMKFKLVSTLGLSLLFLCYLDNNC